MNNFKPKWYKNDFIDVPTFQELDNVTNTAFDSFGNYIGKQEMPEQQLVIDNRTGRKYFAPKEYGEDNLRYATAKFDEAFKAEDWWGMVHNPRLTTAENLASGYIETLKSLVNFTAQVPTKIVAGAAGLLASNIGGQTYKEWDNLYRASAKNWEETLAKAGLSQEINTGLAKVGAMIGQTGASLLTAAALSSIGGLPAVAAVFGTQQYADIREEYLREGYSFEDANFYAMLAGLAEGGLEAFGFKMWKGAATASKSFRNYALAFAWEAAQEGSQQTAEDIITNLTGLREQEFVDIMADIGIAMLVGGLVGGTGAFFSGQSEQIHEALNRDLNAAKKDMAVPNDTTPITIDEEIAQAKQTKDNKIYNIVNAMVEQYPNIKKNDETIKFLYSSAKKMASDGVSNDKLLDFLGNQIVAFNEQLKKRDLTPAEKEAAQKIDLALNETRAEEFTTERRKIERQAREQSFNISDKLEEDLIKAGRAPEEAAADAKIAQAGSMGLYNLTGVLPQDQIKIDIALEQSENTAKTFNQAAAMYKSRFDNFEDFYNYALKADEADKSFFTFNIAGQEVRLSSDVVKHGFNNHKNTIKNWEDVKQGLESGIITAARSNKPRFNGLPVLLKIKAGNKLYGVSLEVQNKYALITTAFEGTNKGIDTWIKKEQGPNAPYPFIFNSRLPSAKTDGGELVSNLATNSIADIVEKVKGQTLYQGPRGSVTFAEDIKQAFIRFNKTADASTFVHELGHIWLMNVQKMRPYAAKTEFDEFLNNLDSWLGAPVNGAYTVEQQEKFAQALEQYLQEGRAPNAELKTLFERFKEWLSEIYAAVKNYIELSPEAIKTFDTLLAGTGKGQYNIDKIKTKTAAAKAVVDKIKKGQAVSIDGVSVQDIKEALKVMNSRIPAEPKENLLRTLRSKGADYANASKIDKEAYKNARVPNKKTGIQDGLALTLRDWGYMDFDDSAVADYEGLSEKDEEAADLIDRALGGEKIYKVGDEQANKREQFLNDVEKAREVLGPNGEEVARAITELEKKGYRVVEKADIAYLEKQLDQLNNIVDKARILEQNTEEQKKTEAFEKMQKQNALEARRIKTATLEELNKRDIAGKEKMFEDLQNAETPEEIFTAAADILTELEKEFAKTEEGQAEQRKIDVPATNWEAKKVTLLKDIAEISANATKEEQQARNIINEDHLAKQGLRVSLSKEERAELEKARNLLKKSFEKKYLKAFNDALRDEPHIESKDVASIMKVLANNAMEMRLISNMAVNQFIDIAQRKQTANYKKYLSGKIDALLNSKTFAKVGQLRRAKFTPEIMEFMTHAKEIWGLTNMEALKQYDERVKNYNPDNVPSPTEALENRVLEFKALWDQQAPADAKGLYDELLELVRGDRALKQFEEAKKQFNESGRRLILTQALKERTLPKGTKTYLLNAGTDLQSALDVLFGKFDYETMGYDGKMHKATFNAREELAGEIEQIEEQNFLHNFNMAIDETMRSAYGLDTKFQMFDKIKELMDYKKEFINYGFVKDADTNTIATIFRGGKWVDNNKPRTQTLNKLNMIYNYIQYQNHEYVVTAGGIKDVGYAARLERAYGPKQLEEMFNCLTEQDKKFAEGLIELAGKYYPELNEVHKRIYGFALPKIGGVYFPGVTERIADDVDFHADFVANSKSPSLIKQRVKSVKPVVALVNPLAILKAHGRRSAEFIYNAERFTELKRLFKAEEMKTAFVDKFGQKDGIELYQKMLRLIDLQGPQKQKTKGEFFKVSDKIFNNWVKTAMGLKIMTGIKQVASGISFAEKMPSGTYAKYFAEAVKHPVQTMDYMDKSFPYIETRFQTGGLNEAVARAMASNDISAMGEKFNMITNLGLLNTRYGDRISISIFGYPYYKYLREDLNLPEAEAKAEFLRQATTTLQSSLKSQLSEAQSVADNFATRVFMVFRNQQLQYVRKAFTTYAQYRNGEISAKQFAKAEFIYLVLNPLVYVALGLGFIPRDDEDKKRLAFAPITQTMGAYPFGEATAELLVDNIYSAFKEKKLTAPQKMGLPMIDDIVKDITRAVKSVNEDDLTAEDYIDATLGIAKYSGLPLNTFKSMIKGGRDIVKGKPAKGALEVIGYTESRAGKIVGEEKKKKKKKRRK